ncbi:MAG: DEAD/DEAH box helicase [Halieaceae bacterium]|nr:DEAD/DEAH box helicase [Halieaceae bacterium]
MEYPIKGTLLPHQTLALQEANEKRAHAFFLDAGAGKTLTCIAEAGKLYQWNEIDGVLILAPNGPHRQHVTQEFPKWANFSWHGTYNKAPTKELEEFNARSPKAGLGVLSYNYEGAITQRGKKAIDAFIKKYPRFYLILDESQKLKDPRASRTKRAAELAKQATHRRILSGTPILKGLEDMFSQYFILQAGITGKFETSKMMPNYFACRQYYCQLAPVPNSSASSHAKVIVGYRHEPEFRENVRPYTTRVTSDMFMTSEEPMRIRVEVDMVPQQRNAYAQMREHLFAAIDGGLITAQNALVQLGKMQQIACGFIKDEDGKVEWLSKSRIEAAKTVLEGLDEPVILWAPFVPLKERLYDEIDGAILYTELADVDKWKRKGGVIIANQSSGMGVGMNLQNSSANIYVANNFSSEARWQSEKRTDRLGQERLVRYWDLIAPNTVDEKVLSAIAHKKEISARNIDGLRDLAL